MTFDSQGNLLAISLSDGENRIGSVDPETGDVSWFASVPAESPVQAIAVPPGSGASSSRAPRVTTSTANEGVGAEGSRGGSLGDAPTRPAETRSDLVDPVYSSYQACHTG